MHETGYSKPVHWYNPEGWDWEGGGKGLGIGDICTPMAEFMSIYGKIHYNIVK